MNHRAGEHQDPGEGWCGDATSVVEFLRPLRDQLDAPGVLEVCVNRPGELLVETVHGWQTLTANAACHSLPPWPLSATNK
jgi:type IV secretion system protein VirB11